MAASDRRRPLLSMVVAVVLMAGAGGQVSFAQRAAASRSLAETLFQDARRLMSESHYAEACPKLAESQRLDPATGTLLNLAVCHSQEGKLASAWVEFTDALADAHRDGRADREQFAREHLAAIQPRVSHVTITVSEIARIAGLQLKLDGSVIGAAAWGLPAPLDPGPHEVMASAPGRRTWTRAFSIAGDAQNQLVDIPVLETVAPPPVAARGVAPPAGASAAAPAATTGTTVSAPAPLPALAEESTRSAAGTEVSSGATLAEGDGRSRSRTISYVVAGAGVAAVGVGAAFGLRAFSKWSDRNKHCPNSVCDDIAVSDANAASTAAVVADIGVGVGLAAVVTGAILWYRSRPMDGGGAPSAVASLSVLPFATGRGGALVLDGHW